MAEFKSVTYKDWEDQAKKDLRTEESFNKLFKEKNGLQLRPYYDHKDQPDSGMVFFNRFVKPNPAGTTARNWFNVVRIHVNDAGKANATALEALMNGAEGCHFILERDIDIEALLQDILPEYIFLAFSVVSVSQADDIRTWLDQQDVDKADVQAYVSGDFAMTEAHYFQLFIPWQNVKCLNFHLSQHQDSVALNLAKTLKDISDAVDTLIGAGYSPDIIANKLALSVSVGPEYFQEIARLRALRIIVFKMLHAWGASLAPEDITIHAISEPWTKEEFQPGANMIKSSTASIAAILGGCNLLSVIPEDENSQLEQRIARNVSSILKEESYLDRTLDPVAGSYFIEALTDQLARNAWKEFQNLYI